MPEMEKRGRRNFNLLNGRWFPDCLISYPGLSWPAKACWIILNAEKNKKACCSLSQADIAKELGLSASRVQVLLKELEENFFIEREAPSGVDKWNHKSIKPPSQRTQREQITIPKLISEVKSEYYVYCFNSWIWTV